MRTRLYDIWNLMKQRCNNPHANSYQHYGGRGIKVCEEWTKFEPFKKWSIENGYNDSLSIDRINNDGNYEPSNCRWVDISVQSNNKSTSKFISFQGKTQTLKQWSEELGINYYTLQARITKRHWNIEKALTNRMYVGGRKKKAQ